MKIPNVEVGQETSGYVRGYYEFDEEKLNEDVRNEVMNKYPNFHQIKNEDKIDEINNFIKKYVRDNIYLYKGDFMEVRDDKMDSELYINLN